MSAEDRRTWAFGPAGEAQEFACPEDVPQGWRDHPWRAADEAPPPACGRDASSAAQELDSASAGETEGDTPSEAPKRRGRPPKVR